MSEERRAERLEERVDEVKSRVREIEDHLIKRERIWKQVFEKAFLFIAMIVAAIVAMNVAERRER